MTCRIPFESGHLYRQNNVDKAVRSLFETSRLFNNDVTQYLPETIVPYGIKQPQKLRHRGRFDRNGALRSTVPDKQLSCDAVME